MSVNGASGAIPHILKTHQWSTLYNVGKYIPHDDVINWKNSALLTICAGNSRVTGEFPLKGEWRGALMFSLICTWINSWVNNGEAGDLRRHRARYDVIAMVYANTPGEKRQYDQHWESLLMVWSLYPPGTEEQAIMTSASCGMKQRESLTETASIWSSSPSRGVAPESKFRPRHAWIEAANKPMMTSSNGNIFRVTDLLCGEFTGPGEFPAQRPVTRSFDVFVDLCPNKRLSKQSWGWWFETPPWSLWRHCNNWMEKTSNLPRDPLTNTD